MSAAMKIDPAFDFFPVKMIGLRELRDENFVQCRVSTSASHAKKITDFVLDNGPINEPIVVFDDGKDLFLADGIHRVIGYREASRKDPKYKQIRAEIRPGTRDDATVYAAGANQIKTYLPRTPEDIRNSFSKLMDLPEWQKKSPSLVGKVVGLKSHSTSKRYWLDYFSARSLPIPAVAANSRGEIRKTSVRSRRNLSPPTLTKYKNSHQASVDGEIHYLGSGDPAKANEKLAEILREKELVRKSYESGSSIVGKLASHNITSSFAFGSGGSSVMRPGLQGRNVAGIAVVWESFRTPEGAIAAIGRAVCCRAKLGVERAVVLCPVEDGPAEVLDLGRKAGIEFMTIEDFVASLKPQAETT